MTNPSYIREANPANFNMLVLENSEKVPVTDCLRFFRAAPCLKLMPRIIGLAAEYCGKILLVMLDADEYGRMAKDGYGISGVPTVKFFGKGIIADTLHGTESDGKFLNIINKFVRREASLPQVNATRVFYRVGYLDQACANWVKAAHYQLTGIRRMHIDFSGAMDQLLKIMRRKPAFYEDAWRKGLLATYKMLGNEHAKVADYRARLAEVPG